MTVAPTVLRGAVRDYDWGVVDGMTPWGVPSDGGPHAELWFGCHHAAPSPLRDSPNRTLADEWGGGATPLLTKILAAARPLSLQVHPSRETLARWNGDPAAQRLLCDQVEKTEMLIAVERFTCLADWRPPQQALRVLAEAGAGEEVLAALRRGDPTAAARLLLTDRSLRLPAQQWHRAAVAAGAPEEELHTLSRVTDAFGPDPGVAVAVMLQPLVLAPGDAVYVPAGVPHAYVHGLGVEVMTSSDNVLRLGLTSKTVAVPYALDSLDSRRSAVVAPSPPSGRYNIDGAPFSVAMIDEAPHVAVGDAYRLVLALEGASDVVVGPHRWRLTMGEALAIPAEADSARVTAAGRAVVVRAHT